MTWLELKNRIIENMELLVFCGGIISFLRGMWQTRQKNKIEKEKIRSEEKLVSIKEKMDLWKQQKIIHNEEHRKIYGDFVNLIIDEMKNNNQGDQLEKGAIEFMKNAIKFSSPELIIAYGKFQRVSKIETDDANKKTIIAMENILKAMRSEYGISNDGLQGGDLIQILLKDDVKKILT